MSYSSMENCYKNHLLAKYIYCLKRSNTELVFYDLLDKTLDDIDNMGWKIQQSFGNKIEIVNK